MTPKDRYCATCGGLIICKDAKNWGYKCRDYRPGPHHGKIVLFCSWPCKRKFESDCETQKERMTVK